MVLNHGVFDVLGRGYAPNQFNDGVCEFINKRLYYAIGRPVPYSCFPLSLYQYQF